MRTAEAIHVFQPSGPDRESQLALSVGDRVYVLEQDDSGWWAGHKEGSDITGWFPRSAVVITAAANSRGQEKFTTKSLGSLRGPASHRALASLDGRRVASPQSSGYAAGNARYTSSSQRARHQTVFSPIKSLSMSRSHSLFESDTAPVSRGEGEGDAAEASKDDLVHSLSRAFEVERRFARGLEEELQALRALSDEKVKREALEKAWQAPSFNASPRAGSSLVRDLVAAYEQRAKTGVGDTAN